MLAGDIILRLRKLQQIKHPFSPLNINIIKMNNLDKNSIFTIKIYKIVIYDFLI